LEPDINLTESSNEPPILQATFAADVVPVASASMTRQPSTTTYTVPAPAPNLPIASTNAAAGASMYAVTGKNINIGVLGRGSKKIQCPHCAVNTVTYPKEQIDWVTIVASILSVLLFWPLFWLPFVIPGCKATDHYCGSCHRKVGRTPPCQ